MESNLSKFCPQVGGPCIKEQCIAYHIGGTTIVSSSSFDGIIDGFSLFSKPFPITLSIDFHYCDHYDRFIESKEELEELLKDFKIWKQNNG
jgi:hypothetical protein